MTDIKKIRAGLKEISKEYADKYTCYANDPHLQYMTTRMAVEYGYACGMEDMKQQMKTELLQQLNKAKSKEELLGYSMDFAAGMFSAYTIVEHKIEQL